MLTAHSPSCTASLTTSAPATCVLLPGAGARRHDLCARAVLRGARRQGVHQTHRCLRRALRTPHTLNPRDPVETPTESPVEFSEEPVGTQLKNPDWIPDAGGGFGSMSSQGGGGGGVPQSPSHGMHSQDPMANSPFSVRSPVTGSPRGLQRGQAPQVRGAPPQKKMNAGKAAGGMSS